MKIIHNLTQKPMQIPLGRGKVLHLGPMKDGQISEGDAKRPGVLRLVEEGTVVILEEGESPASARGDRGGAVHEATHGHPQETNVRPKGNR